MLNNPRSDLFEGKKYLLRLDYTASQIYFAFDSFDELRVDLSITMPKSARVYRRMWETDIPFNVGSSYLFKENFLPELKKLQAPYLKRTRTPAPNNSAPAGNMTEKVHIPVFIDGNIFFSREDRIDYSSDMFRIVGKEQAYSISSGTPRLKSIKDIALKAKEQDALFIAGNKWKKPTEYYFFKVLNIDELKPDLREQFNSVGLEKLLCALDIKEKPNDK